jgi:cation:H+ antiporter
MNLLFGSLLLSIVGLLALLAGGEALVVGASRLAKRFRVHPAIIGLTVVAFATSVPELCVSLIAVSKNKPDIAVGNVLGSNVFNTLMVIGVAAVMVGWKQGALRVQATVFRRELVQCMWLSLGITALLFLLPVDGKPALPLWLGVLLLLGLVHMLWRLTQDAKANPTDVDLKEEAPPIRLIQTGLAFVVITLLLLRTQGAHFPLRFSSLETVQVFLVVSGLSLLFTMRSLGIFFPLLWGLVALIAGSNLLVVGAQGVALEMGLEDAVIALVGIAIGTSAPELATTISAVRRNDVDMAVGNAVGSNLFNLMAVLGGAAVAHGLINGESSLGPLNPRLPWDAAAAALSLAIVLVAARKAPHFLSKRIGGFMIACWFLYLVSMAWEPQITVVATLP